MAELSKRSGVPIATIKYYLREGLVPAGVPTSATRAEYGEAHLRRLRLIRALLEIGELPIAAIGRIVSAVDDEGIPVHQLLGTVQYALGPQIVAPAGDPEWQAARAEVDALLAGLGWRVAADAPARDLLAGTLRVLHELGADLPGPALSSYADAIGPLAAEEVGSIPVPQRRPSGDAGGPGEDGEAVLAERSKVVEAAIGGMVLYERVLVALRRLAQEDASARRFGLPGGPAGQTSPASTASPASPASPASTASTASTAAQGHDRPAV
jgi:DNA-binding transcriptional MerR regulator